MIVNPCGRRRWRRESRGAICGSEMAGDFAARIIYGVNVQVSFAFLDDFDKVGGRQNAREDNLPNVAAVRLRSDDVNIENDLPLEILGLVSICMNVLGGDGRRQTA